MGMEVRDACSEKEPDGLIIYSDSASPVLSYKTEATDLESMESLDNGKGVPEACIMHEEYEVKECTTDTSSKASETPLIEKCEKHSHPCKIVDDIHPEEDVKAFSMKTKDERKPRVSVKHSSNGRASCTIPQPFALATEKRASARPAEIEADVNKLSVKSKSAPIPNRSKKNQPISMSVSRKQLQPDNNKHPDEDDANSATSDALPSTRPSRSKITVASAPIFRSSERAEKRREFYSKLEEKHQALEAEKLQSEARTQEEKEAAIKQLRKSLMFKASPMPSFYHEGPPPKLELKKAPPTRAKSPKLGRRKSCSDADDKRKNNSSKGNRPSLGIQKKLPCMPNIKAEAQSYILTTDEISCMMNGEGNAMIPAMS